MLHSCFFFFKLFSFFSETGVDEDEELYDCVYGEDEGGEVYEDLMKDEAAQQPVCFLIPSYFEQQYFFLSLMCEITSS